jgi:hypothetical protein
MIDINILVHERPSFLDITAATLSRVDEALRTKIRVNLLHTKTWLSHDYPAIINTTIDVFTQAGIKAGCIPFSLPPPYNFMDKIKWSVSQNAEYIIRVDDDCFASPATWSHLIRSAPILDNPRVLAVAPCVSNGLPTFEEFVVTFCTEEEKRELHQMCFDNPILEKWTNDYSNLREAYESDLWDADLYYKLLYKNGDDRLGVHPVRFNLDIQKRINEVILSRWDDFMDPPCIGEYYPLPHERPYYCNTCFMIKRDTYRTIIEDPSLKRDAFEEISFNLYRRQNNLELCFLTDSWMMNMFFRSVGNYQIEEQLAEKIRGKLNEQ